MSDAYEPDPFGLLDDIDDADGDEGADEPSPVIELVDQILREATRVDGVSSIHVEPAPDGALRVRARVDGTLRPHGPARVPAQMARAVIARLKILALVDISERRLPQYGRLSFRSDARTLECYVATIPTSRGERVTLRLEPERGSETPSLDEMGLEEADRTALDAALASPGLVLLTGGTSCLCDLLIACLDRAATPDRSALAIASRALPLARVPTVEIAGAVGMTPEAAVLNARRSDVDVLAVHAPVTLDTMQQCVTTAHQGALVIATLPLRLAPCALSRLLDMGIEPWLLADVLTGVIGACSVRTLCGSCRRPADPVAGEDARGALGLDPSHALFEPGGCEQCAHTGWSGRRIVAHAQRIDADLRRAIVRRDLDGSVSRYAQSFRAAVLARAVQGETSIAEALLAARVE